MGLLAARMTFSHPSDPPSDNPNLPAGYTYLLQLIAHDLVQSTVALSQVNGDGGGVQNHRGMQLRLDTVYGGGPLVCPLAYALDDKHRRNRTRLRLGRIYMGADNPAAPAPFRDIARTSAENVTGVASEPNTEPLIADPRNDDHVVLSQMTALFHLLHNGIVDALTRQERAADVAAPDIAAFRRFRCARDAATLIYRRVIRKDLLRRLLVPTIYDAYDGMISSAWAGDAVTDTAADAADRPAQCVDRAAFGLDARDRSTCRRPLESQDWRMPLEFSHAAFRFAHTMVRDGYRLNDRPAADFTLEQILMQTSGRAPVGFPLTRDWVVQWSHFFNMPGGTAPNASRLITPRYSPGFLAGNLLPSFDEKQLAGLAYRDLLSSALAGMWKTDALIMEIARRRPDLTRSSRLLSDPDHRRDQIAAWLARPPAGTAMAACDVAHLAADPPLLFFVLLEAELDPAARRGERLGHLGSILVAEVMCGALARDPLPAEIGTSTLTGALAALSTSHYGENRIAMPPEIETMAQLIQLVATLNNLNSAEPRFV